VTHQIDFFPCGVDSAEWRPGVSDDTDRTTKWTGDLFEDASRSLDDVRHPRPRDRPV